MKKIKLMIILIVGLSLTNLFADDKSKNIEIEKFLAIGPISVNVPFSVEGDEYNISRFLDVEHIQIKNLWPKSGEELQWNNSQKYNWKEIESVDDIELNSDYSILYLATYVKVDRYTSLELNLKSHSQFKLYVDGEEKGIKKKINKSDKKPGKFSKKINLESGKHLVLVKLLIGKSNKLDFVGDIKIDEKFVTSVTATTDNVKFTDVSNLLNDPKIRSAAISADGKIASVVVTRRSQSGKSQKNWIDFYDVKSKKLLKSNEGFSEITRIDWAPIGNKYAFTTNEKEGTNLYVADFISGKTLLLIEEYKDFSGFEWAPNGEFLVFSHQKKLKDFSPDLKKYDTPDDRLPWSIYQSVLYKLNYPQGTIEQITFGDVTTSLNSISPDSKQLIFTRTKKDMSERPFSKTTLYKMDLETYDVEEIHTSKFGISATWSPDGKKLLISGAPTTFGNAGLDLPEDVIPNDYDSQAYIYDLQTKSVKAFTKKFNPSVRDMNWSNHNIIYLRTVDQTYNNVYKYYIDEDKFEKINLGVEVVGDISFDKNINKAVYVGESSNKYAKVYVYDFNNSLYELLVDVNIEKYNSIKLGEVKDFDFENEEGINIKGRVYYPPNFDPNKKYPAIINYYAGTSPMTRNFEGRYPANIWAANGYVVYILSPQGTYGFGQKYSAKHVNDWGEISAKEIMKGTEEFLKAHKFVDPEKLGIIGASYGGFETMNLITKTDMYAAAISHAGISDLTSYWGEGYWGYSYSAVASANSYPWNNKKLYVDHSPLFNADKINTPLLLLHGDADTNVPPGESYQMYVALKILNKQVDMVTIKGLDHHIMEYYKRTKWTKTILAYFDKTLKDQPEWWESLFK